MHINYISIRSFADCNVNKTRYSGNIKSLDIHLASHLRSVLQHSPNTIFVDYFFRQLNNSENIFSR